MPAVCFLGSIERSSTLPVSTGLTSLRPAGRKSIPSFDIMISIQITVMNCVAPAACPFPDSQTFKAFQVSVDMSAYTTGLGTLCKARNHNERFPFRSHLYSSYLLNSPKETPLIPKARLCFFFVPLTFRFSMGQASEPSSKGMGSSGYYLLITDKNSDIGFINPIISYRTE